MKVTQKSSEQEKRLHEVTDPLGEGYISAKINDNISLEATPCKKPLRVGFKTPKEGISNRLSKKFIAGESVLQADDGCGWLKIKGVMSFIPKY